WRQFLARGLELGDPAEGHHGGGHVEQDQLVLAGGHGDGERAGGDGGALRPGVRHVGHAGDDADGRHAGVRDPARVVADRAGGHGAGPGAACASTIAIAARGRSTVTAASGTDSPLSNSSRYLGTRETPCESTPRRLAQTSASATASLPAAVTPRAAKIPATSARRPAAPTVTLAGLAAATSGI